MGNCCSNLLKVHRSSGRKLTRQLNNDQKTKVEMIEQGRKIFSSNGDRIFELFDDLLPELKHEVLNKCTIQELAMIKQCNREMMRLIKANVRSRTIITVKSRPDKVFYNK